MQASIIYKNGWILVVPKTNNAPMLFIEWLSYFNAAECPIHHVSDIIDFFHIRINGSKGTVYESALKYINDNL